MTNLVEKSVKKHIEPLLSFLKAERLAEGQLEILKSEVERELTPLSKDPPHLLEGSLDWQKISDNLYKDKNKKRSK